jgi:hypothetical protein
MADCCARCKAPSGAAVARGMRGTHDEGTYMLDDGKTFDADDGRFLGRFRGSEYESDHGAVIRLTKGLCQYCYRADPSTKAKAKASLAEKRAGKLPGIE